MTMKHYCVHGHTQILHDYRQFNLSGKQAEMFKTEKHVCFQYACVFPCSIILQAVRRLFQMRHLNTRKYAGRTIFIFFVNLFQFLFLFNLRELKGLG